MASPGYLSGVPEILILRLLSDREMYGYEIVQAIEVESESEIVLGEGVVYPVLHSLEQRGLLKARRKPVNGRTRVYYSVTRTGKERLRDVASEWTRIASAVSRILDGGRDGKATI
ncbi:MAG TPA: PadR family transcriptional regulator [Polyangiales bacterium]|nr:PadR family transcriptional regulator [Polyangiales bacterium]